MNKPIRKLTTKKLFGTKVHDDLIIKLKSIASKADKFYLNGNLIKTSNPHKNDLECILFEDNMDWVNSDYNWLTFGLCCNKNLLDYNFDYLPENGFAFLRNYLAEITGKIEKDIRRYGIKGDDFSDCRAESYSHPLLFELQSAIWKEGVCKAGLNNTTIMGGSLDCIVFGYGMDDEHIKIHPSQILNGYDLGHIKGKHFYGRKTIGLGSYPEIELISQPIGSYIIITTDDGSEIALRLNSRYVKDDWCKAHKLLHPDPIEELISNVKAKIVEKGADDNPLPEKDYMEIISDETLAIKELCHPFFSYTIYPTLEEISIPWEKIRSDYENKGFIKVGKPFYLCGHLDIKEVKSIRIEDEFDYIPELNTSLTLNQKLGFNDDITINLSFDLKEDFFAFQELKKDIEINGNFLSNLRDLSDMVTKGFVTGYDTIFELKAFFDNQGKIDSTKENVSEKANYLKTIKNVLIDNIADGNIKQQVIDIVKSLIHSSSNTSQNINTTNLKTVDIDFSKDPRVGISAKVEFLVLSEEDQNQLNRFLKEVETGEFYSNLVRIKKLVTNSYITGFYDRLELKDYFGEQGGVEPDSDDVKKSLDCLSEPIWFRNIDKKHTTISEHVQFKYL